jgi:hypothetical protein
VLIRKLLKDHAKAKFEAAFPEMQGKTVEEAEMVIDQVLGSIQKIGDSASDDYDKTTEDGTKGGEDQQNIAEMSFIGAVEKSEKKK